MTWQVFEKRNYDSQDCHSVLLVGACSIDHEDALNELDHELEEGLRLTLTDSEKSLGVLADEVLNADSDLRKVLVSESTVNIVFGTGNDVHHLRE